MKNNFQKVDVYRFTLEKLNEIISLNISNSITWDDFTIKATKEELKDLVDFLNCFLEKNNV